MEGQHTHTHTITPTPILADKSVGWRGCFEEWKANILAPILHETFDNLKFYFLHNIVD